MSPCREAWRTWTAMLVLSAAFVPSARAADVAYGEYLAAECVTCHQRSGNTNGIPSIVGWPADQFEVVIKAYRWKERDNVVMQTIAARLTDEDIQALAAYFEALGAAAHPPGPGGKT
ncbi:MAG: c-type cytochrome [Hyphomicrobiaceae bacterium]